jgi:hypothetical protein
MRCSFEITTLAQVHHIGGLTCCFSPPIFELEMSLGIRDVVL